MMRLAFVALLLGGCVRSVTVCATYDRALRRVPVGEYSRDSAGASVCAEAGPP